MLGVTTPTVVWDGVRCPVDGRFEVWYVAVWH